MTKPAIETPAEIEGPIHASCVAMAGRAVLITGASGRGKSALALWLMALGARLVADDYTELRVRDGALMARAPAATTGTIEARGVGLLAAEVLAEAPVGLVVDLDREESERLPPQRFITLLGCRLPLVHGSRARHFPAAIAQYMKAGRSA